MSTSWTPTDHQMMSRALALAARGQGHVEPNPMVGCVIARGQQIVGEGWHQQFGGPHAEVIALNQAGEHAAGATLYVTLEPCSHHGKTPPCVDAIVRAKVQRVVIAMVDPFPHVHGQGIARLKAAGLEVELGLGDQQTKWLNAPFVKLITRGRPWIIAKWAMTIDGKIATCTGESRWISNRRSRDAAHCLRHRVDGIVIGIQTALKDDPHLTPRPTGPRTPTRVLLDSHLRLPLSSQLVRTAGEAPVLVATSTSASPADQDRLRQAGCEVLTCAGRDRHERLGSLLNELGRRQWTNVLVEGGATVLGTFFDLAEIDEVHVFVAAKLVGGQSAPSPIGGQGHHRLSDALTIQGLEVQTLDGDLYLYGRISAADRQARSRRGDEFPQDPSRP